MREISKAEVLFKDGVVAAEEYVLSPIRTTLTPGVFLGIDKSIDLKYLIEYERSYGVLENVIGFYFGAESKSEILDRLDNKSELYLSRREILLLPMTELLYRSSRHKDDLWDSFGRDSTIRYFYKQPWRDHAPSGMQQINYFTRWLQQEKIRSLYTGFIASSFELQRQWSFTLVPPTPPILNSKLLQYAFEVYETALELELEDTYGNNEPERPIALFLNFGSRSMGTIERSEEIQKLLTMFLETNSPQMVILKVFDEGVLTSNKRLGYTWIVQSIIDYCKENGKPCMIVDSYRDGYLGLFRGTNFYGTRLRPNTSYESQRRKGGPPPEDVWKTYDREDQIFVPWKDWRELVRERGGIPYSEQIGGYYTPSLIARLNRTQRTKLRRFIYTEAVNLNLRELHDAIQKGEVRTIKARLLDTSLRSEASVWFQ